MIFRAEKIRRKKTKGRGGAPYFAYDVYAENEYIGVIISRSKNDWIVPWPKISGIFGKQSFDSLKDAARHLYIGKEKFPSDHRDWSIQISMQFHGRIEKDEDDDSIETSQIAMGIMRRMKKLYEVRGPISLSISEMSSIFGIEEEVAEKGVKSLVRRGILVPRVGNRRVLSRLKSESLSVV